MPTPSDRLPRPRGDGPHVGLAVLAAASRLGSPAHAGMDPPAVRHFGLVGHGGSPAHAGMDPSASEIRVVVPDSAPPPTRGWTLCGRSVWNTVDDGSPAHAGMDPFPVSDATAGPLRGSPAHAGMDPALNPHGEASWPRRLPRPRGDEPPTNVRQWRLDPHPSSSPAHAGMDPIGLFGPNFMSDAGSPAHAGMDPILGVTGASDGKAPPPTRGWTLRH